MGPARRGRACARAPASLANCALSDGNNKTNKLPEEQSAPPRYIPDLHGGSRKQGIAYGLRPLNALQPPDDRVNAGLGAAASKTAASAPPPTQ